MGTFAILWPPCLVFPIRRNAASTTRRVGRYFALGNTCPVQLFLVIIIIIIIIITEWACVYVQWWLQGSEAADGWHGLGDRNDATFRARQPFCQRHQPTSAGWRCGRCMYRLNPFQRRILASFCQNFAKSFTNSSYRISLQICSLFVFAVSK